MIRITKYGQILQKSSHLAIRNLNSVATTSGAAEELVETDNAASREIRNKSRLLHQHRNILYDKVPYAAPHSWIHQTEKYQRKVYGRYGSQSNVNPRICFDTKEDLAAKERYERIAHPHSLPEMMSKARAAQEEARERVLQRELDIEKKLEKLDAWKQDLYSRIAKKEAATLAAKERKERIVEETRRHFGFNVDPRDERFKEMLEQKEREHKKKEKEQKRKIKEEKMLAKLVEKTTPTAAN